MQFSISRWLLNMKWKPSEWCRSPCVTAHTLAAVPGTRGAALNTSSLKRPGRLIQSLKKVVAVGNQRQTVGGNEQRHQHNVGVLRAQESLTDLGVNKKES